MKFLLSRGGSIVTLTVGFALAGYLAHLLHIFQFHSLIESILSGLAIGYCTAKAMGFLRMWLARRHTRRHGQSSQDAFPTSPSVTVEPENNDHMVFATHLRAKTRFQGCPLCGHNGWNIQGPVLMMEGKIIGADESETGPKAFPMMLVVCQNCLFVLSFVCLPLLRSRRRATQTSAEKAS